MLVSLYLQGLLPTTRNTVTKALHHIQIDRRSLFSKLARLAQAEGQMYRA